MTKDTLRNEIAEIVAECCVDLNVPEATSQILSLLEGSLPEDKVVEDLKGQIDYGYMQGWNACLQQIKEKMK